MANSIVMKSFYAALAAFVLCMISATAGGMTWGATTAGWVVFLSVCLSVAAGVGAFCWQVELAAQQWRIERRDVIDRLDDAQKCIKAEEQSHGRTRQELISVRQQLTQANTDATTAKTEYGNMRDRAAERGRTIKALEDRIASDNNTWRKQVSNLAESAYKMAVHIEGSANGLPDEWQEWGSELARDLRKLASAGGVQVEPQDNENQLAMPIETVSADAWATPAETLDAMQAVAFERVPLVQRGIDAMQTQCQPTPIHIAYQLMAKVRENQAQRRADLDVITKAVENGYELSEAFTAAYHRGMLWVTDELIASERRYIEHSQPSE